jgi:O-antigen ligase
LPTGPAGPASPANTGLGFGLFVFANMLLFVRPMEYLGDIVGQRFFLIAILACLLTSFPAVLVLFNPRTLGTRPVLVLVLLLWPVIVLSSLVHGQIDTAAEVFVDFGKTLLYFFLLVGLVTTPGRLRSMLFWLPLFMGCVATIAVLQAHGLIQLEQFKALEETAATARLHATGLFGDPNDLGVALVVAIVCCVYFIYSPRVGLHSLFWLALLGLFLYTLQLTRSRGAMLALGGALFILLRARIGTFLASLLGILSLPGLLLLTGREVDVHAREDTAASRFSLWSDAMDAFTESRGLGVGYEQLDKQIGLVAHNAYLHAFSELGFIGGCIFLGVVVWAVWALLAMESKKRVILNPDLRALHPIMTAALVGYAVGMGSLSLCYRLPTYTVFGLTAAYLHMTATSPPMPRPRLNDRFYLWLALLGVIFLGLMKVALRFLPRG